MRFLLPVGGITDFRFGILTSPQHSFAGIPQGITEGMDWAADLGCEDGPEYVKRLDPDTALPWLDSMLPYRARCLFVTVPDVLENAMRTIDAYWRWNQHFAGWPLAFVAQDGQERLAFPDNDWQVLFVGGSTDWKLGIGCEDVIQRAQALGKQIHIGRVNYWRRYAHFRRMLGSEEWTCDGTRIRFEGTHRAIAAWAGYMAQPPLHRFVSRGHYRRQSGNGLDGTVGDTD